MKTFIKISLLFFLITSTLFVTIYLGLGFLVSLHATKPEKADVIIVLGGDNGLRVKKGTELFKAGYAQNIVLTGIDSRYYNPNRPNWRERRVMEAGISKKAITVDIWSETTWEEAENTFDLMGKKGWNSALVVSDPPHMLRLYKTWKKAFAGSSKSFILVATDPEWWDPLFWWRDPYSQRFVLSEIKKNFYYLLAYY
ncbi:MAG TPA: YdcF family protein [Chlorobaculum parvum]|uniref:YdcF family protein n=1 Tax=Chlorobaculum parvum TaxID=274539 RepID=A0A7C5DDT8_9CHLB|nr:YdcF family protein [Chlorobaculum parvum]